MKKYIGIKVVEARPMARGAYNEYRQWDMPDDENPADEGYLVRYLGDNYESWCPKEAFEKHNSDLGESVGEKITIAYMKSRIDKVEYHRLGETVTICNITLDSGFSVRGESACVDPANYNQTLGEQISYDNAVNGLWSLFGFLLAEHRHLRK